jgi:hypothetical protein
MLLKCGGFGHRFFFAKVEIKKRLKWEKLKTLSATKA